METIVEHLGLARPRPNLGMIESMDEHGSKPGGIRHFTMV
jgi:hypothetical protein